jgi:hypothetical protein
MHSPLDHVLLYLSDYDPWTARDACEGVIVLASPGAGKTAIVGRLIAHHLLKNGMGGLILTAKSSETRRWLQYAKEAGREKDVILFSESSGLCYDPFAYEFNRPGRGQGDVESVIEFFSLLMSVGRPSTGQGHEDKFWELACEQLMRNIIKLLALAKQPISIANIHRVIQTLPTERVTGDDFESWIVQEGNYCGQVIAKLRECVSTLTPSQREDAQIASAYIGDKATVRSR